MDNYDLTWLHSKIRECETVIRECQEAIERKQRERLEATSSVQLVVTNVYYHTPNNIYYDIEYVQPHRWTDDPDLVFALACDWTPF